MPDLGAKCHHRQRRALTTLRFATGVLAREVLSGPPPLLPASRGSDRKSVPLYEAEIEDRLADERGRRVVFLSHCLLNQNVRYPGGAVTSAGLCEVVDGYLHDGIGVYQMPCPEQRVWGGVRKRLILPAFGSGGTRRAALIRLLFPLFKAYTGWRYRRMAARVAADARSYAGADMAIMAIVGVGGSPSCGVNTTLDLAATVTALTHCPLGELTRERLNSEMIAAHVTPGTGWFIQALRRRLDRRRLAVPVVELDVMRISEGGRLPD